MSQCKFHRPQTHTNDNVIELQTPRSEAANKLPLHGTASEQCDRVTEGKTCVWGYLMTTYGVSKVYIYFLAVEQPMSAPIVLQTSTCISVEIANKGYAI